MVLVVQNTVEIPQPVDTVVDYPVVRSVQILRCRCGEDIRAPTVAASLRTSLPADYCSFRSCSFMVVHIRGAEAVSHGLADHVFSPVARS